MGGITVNELTIIQNGQDQYICIINPETVLHHKNLCLRFLMDNVVAPDDGLMWKSYYNYHTGLEEETDRLIEDVEWSYRIKVKYQYIRNQNQKQNKSENCIREVICRTVVELQLNDVSSDTVVYTVDPDEVRRVCGLKEDLDDDIFVDIVDTRKEMGSHAYIEVYRKHCRSG